jgi:hypothetical protein
MLKSITLLLLSTKPNHILMFEATQLQIYSYNLEHWMLKFLFVARN